VSTTTIERPTQGEFRAEVRGVVYTDRDDYLAAAKGLGWPDRGSRDWKMRPGVPVEVRLTNGQTVHGSVWSKSADPELVWVALETQRFVAVDTSGDVYDGPRKIGTAS
jgi:hypothetical protein